jgi:hypothetical protein
MVCGVLALTGMGACGGESAEEQAQKQVCDARADIQTQIDTIRGLPIASGSIDKARAGLQSIRDDLRQIGDAQSGLSGERKQQVQSATATFTAQVESIARTAVTSGIAGDVESAVKTAADQLGSSFRQAMAPIDCTSSS